MNGPRLPPEEPVFPSQLKDVRLSESEPGRFSFRPRLFETLAAAAMLAAAFLGMSILIVMVVPIPSHDPEFGGLIDLIIWSFFTWVFVAVPFVPVALFRATRSYGHNTWASSAHGFLLAGLFWCALWCFLTPGESPGTLNVIVVRSFFLYMLDGTLPSQRFLLAIPAAFIGAAIGSELVIWSARTRVA